MGDLKEYLYYHIPDNTAYAGSTWDAARDRQGALYPFIPINDPKKEDFLGIVRKALETSPSPDPLDGKEHTLAELSRWVPLLELPQLALRLIVLGKSLDLFVVDEATWNPPPRPQAEGVDEWIRRVLPQNECRFWYVPPSS